MNYAEARSEAYRALGSEAPAQAIATLNEMGAMADLRATGRDDDCDALHVIAWNNYGEAVAFLVVGASVLTGPAANAYLLKLFHNYVDQVDKFLSCFAKQAACVWVEEGGGLSITPIGVHIEQDDGSLLADTALRAFRDSPLLTASDILQRAGRE